MLLAAEVLSGLDGPVKAIREATPQARHSFTVADQVNQLVSASEADPDPGFMARLMVLCSLPRTNPGHRIRYVRRNGPYRASGAGIEPELYGHARTTWRRGARLPPLRVWGTSMLSHPVERRCGTPHYQTKGKRAGSSRFRSKAVNVESKLTARSVFRWVHRIRT